jgi:RND family efflux transporter MFP subunit
MREKMPNDSANQDRRASAGRRRHWVTALSILLVGGGLAYAILVGKPAPEPQAPPEAQPPRVDVVAVRPARRALTVQTQGTVQPLREIDLVSQVAGRVVSTGEQFAPGGFFSAGQVLVKVEEDEYRFAIARAESQVASARQRLAEERGRALQARREWRDLDSKQANDLFLRKPQLAAAEAAVRAAEADLDAARLDLERTSLTIPFNGRIREKLVDIGQYVTPGTPVARVYATDVAQVRLPLTDRQVALLHLPLSYEDSAADSRAGADVVLQARFANRTWEWRGEIVRTDASIDIDSRVVYAVAEVERPFARDAGSERPPLAPGLFVNASITGREIDGVVELPRNALRSDNSVLIVDPQRRAQHRPVEILQSTPHRMWVLGLDRGDRVIVSDSGAAVAGMEVTVNATGAIASRGH